MYLKVRSFLFIPNSKIEIFKALTMIWLFMFIIINLISKIDARIHPIEIRGNHFYDSVTNKPVRLNLLNYPSFNQVNINIRLSKFYHISL